MRRLAGFWDVAADGTRLVRTPVQRVLTMFAPATFEGHHPHLRQPSSSGAMYSVREPPYPQCHDQQQQHSGLHILCQVCPRFVSLPIGSGSMFVLRPLRAGKISLLSAAPPQICSSTQGHCTPLQQLTPPKGTCSVYRDRVYKLLHYLRARHDFLAPF